MSVLSKLNAQRKAWRATSPAAHDMLMVGLAAALLGAAAVGVLWATAG